MLAADRLSAAKLRAGLGHHTIGRKIIVLDETTSTNDVIARWRTEVLRKASSFSPNTKPRVAGNAATFGESPAGKGLRLFYSAPTERCGAGFGAIGGLGS